MVADSLKSEGCTDLNLIAKESSESAGKTREPTAAYSLTVRVQIANKPGEFNRLTQFLASHKASLAEVTLLSSDFDYTIRDVTFFCLDHEHQLRILDGFKSLVNIDLLEWQDDTLALHKGGKLDFRSKFELNSVDDLARVYSPGVARACKEIEKDVDKTWLYTNKCSTVAVVSDGSAVLGLGDIGGPASLPVMEGKSVLFKRFGGIDSFPIIIDSQDVDEIVKVVRLISAGLGGVNLEDISAPRCFEIERKLQDLGIPVFHDDQHGTAVVVLAGLINALKLTKRNKEDIRVVINGFGAAGVAITKILLRYGVKNIIPCDSKGVITADRSDLNWIKREILGELDREVVNSFPKGSVFDAMKGADVFIGVSKGELLSREDIITMAAKPIIFALANPVPEVWPHQVKDIVGVIATGRSDFPNQINNVLAFPGIFRGALDCRATRITDNMKLVAARAIADIVPNRKLQDGTVIPGVFNDTVPFEVAERVRLQAIEDGVARISGDLIHSLVGMHNSKHWRGR